MVLELVACNNLHSTKPALDRVIPPWLANLHIPTMSPHANGKRKTKLTADWQQEMVLFVANCIKFHLTAFNDIDVVVHGLLDPKVPSSPPFRQVGNRTEKRPSLGVFIQISFSKTKGPKRF